ncbi:MAG: glyceraldehyde-3-phosphate dehydrogenase [Pseudomonadales bacterium]
MAEEQKRPKPADYFSDWKQREALAEDMIPLIGKLYREHNVNTYIYGQQLYSRSVIDIMKAHRFVRQIENNELSEFNTFPIVKAIAALNLGRAHVDVGRIAVEFMKDSGGLSVEDFVKRELAEAIGTDVKPIPAPRDVVLYGFGRIGRLMARLLIEKAGGGDVLRLRAIVVRKGKGDGDLEKRASLLRRDSVHGPFRGTIRVDEETNSFIANGNEIKIIYADKPEEIDYTQYGINNAIIVENTGKLTDEAGLSKHLKAKGVSQVLLTAPAKGDIKNIVFGVNHDQIQDDKIISAASCTTNAVVPALKAINDKFGVKAGHIETVHAYTNDQNLIDNYHKAERRGRSAPLNMVITSTGAAKAVAKALPELAGKLTGNAIRVPIPNVSMAILNLELEKDTTVEELNEYMRHMALHSPLRKQIDFTNSTEVVSSDFVGSRHACIFDAKATIVKGNHAVMYLWYDNEFGYSCQVHRVLERLAGVNYRVYPKE